MCDWPKYFIHSSTLYEMFKGKVECTHNTRERLKLKFCYWSYCLVTSWIKWGWFGNTGPASAAIPQFKREHLNTKNNVKELTMLTLCAQVNVSLCAKRRITRLQNFWREKRISKCTQLVIWNLKATYNLIGIKGTLRLQLPSIGPGIITFQLVITLLGLKYTYHTFLFSLTFNANNDANCLRTWNREASVSESK